MSDLIRNLIAGRLNAVDADRAVVKVQRVERVQAAYVSSVIDPFVALALTFVEALFATLNASLEAPYLWAAEDVELAKALIVQEAMEANHNRMWKLRYDAKPWAEEAQHYASWTVERLYLPASFKRAGRYYIKRDSDPDEGMGYTVYFDVERRSGTVDGPFDSADAAYAAAKPWRESTFDWDARWGLDKLVLDC